MGPCISSHDLIITEVSYFFNLSQESRASWPSPGTYQSLKALESRNVTETSDLIILTISHIHHAHH